MCVEGRWQLSTKRHLPRSCFELPLKWENTAEAASFSPEHKFSMSPVGMWRGAVMPPSRSTQGPRELSARRPPGTQASRGLCPRFLEKQERVALSAE